MGEKPLKFEDYDGKKFGRLTIIGLSDKYSGKGEIIVNCLCDCGNKVDAVLARVKSGNTKSCGCQKIDSAIKVGSNRLVDLTGMVFGRLTVVSRYSELDSNRTLWYYKCECGNTTISESYSLKNGYKKSCGCISRETTSAIRLKDMTGQKFGKWTVIERYGLDDSGKNATWTCMCECGNVRVISGNSLRVGGSMSCGCEKSRGEVLMSDTLHNAGIQFEPQKRFSDCKYSHVLSFDFYIQNINTAIEIQGIQHYEPVKYFGGYDNFLVVQERDKSKRKYCKRNNIELIEISYDRIDSIPQIVEGLKLKYNVKDVI